jgi:NSS family neurotransmitter:Na+ symporter
VAVLILSVILGIPSSLGNGIWSNIKLLGMDFLSFFDFISNSVIMPVVALFTCVFVGYVIKPKSVIDEVELSGKFKAKTLFNIVIKYFAPICIILILISSILSAMGIMSI